MKLSKTKETVRASFKLGSHAVYPNPRFRFADEVYTNDGKSIGNDCSTCHNLVAVDEVNPKQLDNLGFQ